ncbi:retention module-containing protein, partial [Marinomonas balearica]|uniref:retention module-containing protein n=1 Tax=Marinomonas balearica TaxID=491947 RepID=UPI001414CE90
MSDNQVSFATLGNAVGFVTQVSGTVKVQSIDGQERIINPGDPIFYGETVVAVGGGSATIEFVDGTQIIVANQSVVEITDEIFSFDNVDQELVADSSSEADALQEAILAGQDPTLIQDAPAAGEETTTGEEEQRFDVSVSRSNDDNSLPTFGYDTDNERSVLAGGTTTGGADYYGTSSYDVPSEENASPGTGNPDESISKPVVALSSESDSGVSQSDNLTNDTTATFTLTNIDSDVALVEVFNGATLIQSTTETSGISSFTTGSNGLSEGENTITVRVTDSSGNSSTSDAVVVTLDTSADAGTVSVDSITADDMINAVEAAGTITVSGVASGGDISEGDSVSLEVNETTYTTTVGADGTWSVDVAGSDLAADTEFDAVVTSSDDAGNSVESIGSSAHTLDTSSLSINLDIDPITDDSILNAVEAGGNVTVTGSVTGDDFDSGDVTLTVNGTKYQGEVTNGQFAVVVAGSDLEADDESLVDASVSVSNAIGQTGTTTSTEAYLVDTSAIATIRVDSISPDDVINAQEAGLTVTVTGRVGFDAHAGDTVTAEINNTPYTATVQADKTWSVEVAGSDLVADADATLVASVKGQDGSGNAYSASTSSTYTVDTAATEGTVTVNDITEDDVINAQESGETISVTGTAKDGDIASDDSVKMTINGKEYSTTVSADGTWSVDVAGSDLAADTEFDVVVTSNDDAGNTVETTGSSSHSVDLAATEGTVTVNDITEDDVINAQESGETISVTGTAKDGDIASDDRVEMTINGKEYSTTVNADGTWSVDVAGSDLAADTEFDVVVTSSDDAGNTVETTGSSSHSVDLAATEGTVTVNDITEDDVINAQESGETISVTGTAKDGDIASDDRV